MALRVYILGDAAAYQNYTLAVERAGGIPCFGSRPADCDCLLLPGGGDMESWRYGQKNTACRDLEPERDALELDLLADFTALGKPVLVWGDRIFEKCGIGRDEGGDGGKTLEIRGKRRLSARDGGANYQQS